MGRISYNVKEKITEDLNNRLRRSRHALNEHRRRVDQAQADATFALWDINEIKALAYKYGVTLD